MKSFKEFNSTERCDDCGMVAERIIRFNGHLSADNQDAYFNHGLGKVVRSRADVRAAVADVKARTGRELIEVGNEKLTEKRKPKELEVTREMVHDYQRAKKAVKN